MRRPSPLPPPVSGETRRAAPAGDTASAVEDTERAVEEGGDAAVIPIDPAEASGGAGRVAPVPLPPSAGDTNGSDASFADDAVGIREVWRAARARRKALRAEVRRFTARQRRRRAVWIGVTASLLILALATIGAAYSPLFAVETITVEGVQQLDEADVRAALGDQLGTPLPLVDESEVKAALVTFPLVQSYTLEARPPHELVVRIVERLPIGLIKSPAGYTLVDAAGVALSTTQTPMTGVPLLDIRGGVSSDAFTAAGRIMHALPEEIRSQVTGVTASTPDDVSLRLGGTRTTVVWGSADDSPMKALTLGKAMVSRPPAGVSVYDVSSPTAIVIR
ncbi:FtsQ-type POTRA domain-containing protein [Microbacterium sp. CFH 31415]|uniref:FtsQ-type POTRA domain-containing protein n=1 Tax=Microbacterium sp. CFH 31415 TaxID=2921732 RepID=UPI001F136F17|nr:FtsQ-type POTRA domain-containing protein [Microbacterium sp. CFH 31415]MCH6229808.1 FtsQ-type POTRA domain-containing protein [Microbacterium sp. CFH 31415]